MKRGVIFSDESGIDRRNRFGAICTISGPREVLIKLHSELNKALESYERSDFGFSKVKGQKNLNLAKELVDICLNYIHSRKIWVHILVWDKNDSRHRVQGRDDNANLSRMYYHILKQVHVDWEYIDDWSFYPDQFSAIEWSDDVINFIRSTKFYNDPNLFESEEPLVSFPEYLKVEEKDSKSMSIIQLSDLFAGIVRVSRDKSQEFEAFSEIIPNQLELFAVDPLSISNNLKPKLELLKYFREESSKMRLGVNFSVNKYFATFNKRNNIFIWHYSPKGDYDKAPVKQFTKK